MVDYYEYLLCWTEYEWKEEMRIIIHFCALVGGLFVYLQWDKILYDI